VQIRHHNRFGPETTTHAMRGRFGPIVFGPALAKEALLLFEEIRVITTQLRETTPEAPIALSLQLGEFAPGHTVQDQSVLVEALRHARRLEVREGT
jgi:hypothetical protein